MLIVYNIINYFQTRNFLKSPKIKKINNLSTFVCLNISFGKVIAISAALVYVNLSNTSISKIVEITIDSILHLIAEMW